MRKRLDHRRRDDCERKPSLSRQFKRSPSLFSFSSAPPSFASTKRLSLRDAIRYAVSMTTAIEENGRFDGPEARSRSARGGGLRRLSSEADDPEDQRKQ